MFVGHMVIFSLANLSMILLVNPFPQDQNNQLNPVFESSDCDHDLNNRVIKERAVASFPVDAMNQGVMDFSDQSTTQVLTDDSVNQDLPPGLNPNLTFS